MGTLFCIDTHIHHRARCPLTYTTAHQSSTHCTPAPVVNHRPTPITTTLTPLTHKMYSAIILSAALVAAVKAVTVNTPPSLVQCQPAQLTWGQGTAPFYVSIIPGGQPSAAALESFATQTGMSYTWMVDIAAGTSVTVKVVDSTGDTNYSDQVTIQAGSETTCTSSSSSSGSDSSSSDEDTETTDAAAAPVASATSAAASAATSAASAARTPLSSASSAASKVASSASSGVAAAAATGSNNNTGAASSVKAGLGMLVAGLALAIAA